MSNSESITRVALNPSQLAFIESIQPLQHRWRDSNAQSLTPMDHHFTFMRLFNRGIREADWVLRTRTNTALDSVRTVRNLCHRIVCYPAGGWMRNAICLSNYSSSPQFSHAPEPADMKLDKTRHVRILIWLNCRYWKPHTRLQELIDVG